MKTVKITVAWDDNTDVAFHGHYKINESHEEDLRNELERLAVELEMAGIENPVLIVDISMVIALA